VGDNWGTLILPIFLVAKTMDVETSATDLATEVQNRRATPRLPVQGDASLLVLKHDYRVPCRITDLSMGGCRIETQKEFRAGVEARVEVSFTVNGLLLRFSGITQWTDGQRLVGIRFADVTSRRRNELAEILCEVEEDNAAKAAEQAASQMAADTQPAQKLLDDAEQARPELTVEDLRVQDAAMKLELAPSTSCALIEPCLDRGLRAGCGGGPDVEQAKSPPAVQRPALPVKRERRAQSRHEVDTSATIHLINVGSTLHGRINDLSLGGCRIRTNERFPVGIYTRVETEFQLDGLPFRLGGVVQAVHDRDRFNVGIRFLDMSDRKRAQVEQLIEEIDEMRERKRRAGSADPTEASQA
jgi:c-di-GMP-binding flagellar brake protein YcgR